MGEFAGRPARDRQGQAGTDGARRTTDAASGQHPYTELQRLAGNRAVTQLTSAAAPGIHRFSLPWGKKSSTPTAPKAADPSVKQALDHFSRSDSSSIEAAANAYAKKQKEGKDVELGLGVKGSGKASAGAQAGAFGSAEIRKLCDSYALLVEAGVVVGGRLKLEGELERDFGSVTAKLKGAFDAFAGAYAKANGRLQAGLTGVVAEGSAEAFAGAKSSQKAAIEFTRESLGLEAEASAEEMAGATAKAEGTFAISKEQIAVAGEASAFAGAKAKGSVGGKAKLYGRDAFKGKVSGEVSAGAGGEARGGFRVRRGVIALNLGGNVTVGVGGGGDVDLAADLKPVAVWLWRQIDKARWRGKPEEAENVLTNPDSIKLKLRNKVEKYAERKISLLGANRADNFVKEEKVQAIIGEVLPRKQVYGRSNADAIDAVIKEAVEEGLKGAAPVECANVTATMHRGKLLKLEGLPDPATLKDKTKLSSEKTGDAFSSIILGDSDG